VFAEAPHLNPVRFRRRCRWCECGWVGWKVSDSGRGRAVVVLCCEQRSLLCSRHTLCEVRRHSMPMVQHHGHTKECLNVGGHSRRAHTPTHKAISCPHTRTNKLTRAKERLSPCVSWHARLRSQFGPTQHTTRPPDNPSRCPHGYRSGQRPCEASSQLVTSERAGRRASAHRLQPCGRVLSQEARVKKKL
jgi:hypothetical protein